MNKQRKFSQEQVNLLIEEELRFVKEDSPPTYQGERAARMFLLEQEAKVELLNELPDLMAGKTEQEMLGFLEEKIKEEQFSSENDKPQYCGVDAVERFEAACSARIEIMRSVMLLIQNLK